LARRSSMGILNASINNGSIRRIMRPTVPLLIYIGIAGG